MRFLLHLLAGLLCGLTSLSASGLPTSEVAIVGSFGKGPLNLALEVNASEFLHHFQSDNPENHPAEVQALQFFRNGGDVLSVVRIDPGQPLATALEGSLSPPQLRGLGALLPLSNLGLLICPELTCLNDSERSRCFNQIELLGHDRPLFTLLDPPPSVTTAAGMITWRNDHLPTGLSHSAIYFPKLQVDPASWSGGASTARMTVGASGTIAAVIQKNDISRGIWKAPAGPSATIISDDLSVDLDSTELDDLNQSGINSIRDLPTYGQVIWGSRTLDTLSDNRYLPVARTRRWIERSLQRELSDAALQTNDPALQSSLTAQAEAFLDSLFRQGAFTGAVPGEAYFVKCDSETTTPADIAAHRINVLIGASYLRSAEFMIDKITLATLNESQPYPRTDLLASPPVDGVIYLHYPTFPGFTHQFQSSGILQDNSWFSGSEITGDGSWITLEYPVSSPESFFRVLTTRGWQ